MQLNANPAVAQSLLDRFPLTDTLSVQNAIDALSAAVRMSMQHPAAYNLSIDQALPADHPIDAAATVVHPSNVAAVVLSLSKALGAQAPVDLQVYDNGGWKHLVHFDPVPNVVAIIVPPAPAPAPVAPPPAPSAPPPAPVAAAPEPAPAAVAGPDLMSLVESALGTPQTAAAAQPVSPAIIAPDTTPATPVAPVRPVIEGEATRVAPTPVPSTITTVEEFEAYRAQQLAAQQAAQTPPAPPVQQAPPPVAVPETAPPVQQAPAPQAAPVVHSTGKLPNPDVALPRITQATGREGKSPFLSKVEERKKIAAAPWWQDFWNTSAPQLFTASPAQALDQTSTGSGPVQAYAALVELFQSALLGVDPSATVGELRGFLTEVQNGIARLDDAKAINQLRDALAGKAE